MTKKSDTQAARDNRANQLNPNHSAYHSSRDVSPPVGEGPAWDNRADQLNPNNDAYWQSRGESARPADWTEAQPAPASQPDSKS